MKIIIMSFALVLFTTVFSGEGRAETGGATKKPNPPETSTSGSASTAVQEREVSPLPSTEKSSLIVTRDYIIGPEDVLDITVWRNQDLSKVVQVRPDGRISLPLIGDVTAVRSEERRVGKGWR